MLAAQQFLNLSVPYSLFPAPSRGLTPQMPRVVYVRTLYPPCCGEGLVVPLRYLFVDMNAYFASVEQEYRPELRGKPTVVVAVMTDRTCCLAASYEAKRFGIKTGTGVGEARRMCRGLKVVEARPPLYVVVHEQIVAAVDAVLPVEKVCSIDEMYCRLPWEERTPAAAAALGERVKRSIGENVGSTLKSSVGIAPNALLAKVASDMQKPNGLTIIGDDELPARLYGLKLTDLPGIAHRTEARLARQGIVTIEQLCAAPIEALARVWGSRLIGETWWRRLRGEDLPETPTHRRTVGHSHVLPPELRTDAGAKQVLTKLIHKAAARLRSLQYYARAMSIGLDYLGADGWVDGRRFPPCRDTLTFMELFESLWQHRPPNGRPLKVSTTLFNLQAAASTSASLFPEDRVRSDLADAMDRINDKVGPSGVCFGGMLGAGQAAPTRIAFTNIPSVMDNWFRELYGP